MRAHELVEAGRQHVATGRIREAMACFKRAADDPERGAEALSLLAAAYLLPGSLAPELALAHAHRAASHPAAGGEHLARCAAVALTAGDPSLAEELAGRAGRAGGGEAWPSAPPPCCASATWPRCVPCSRAWSGRRARRCSGGGWWWRRRRPAASTSPSPSAGPCAAPASAPRPSRRPGPGHGRAAVLRLPGRRLRAGRGRAQPAGRGGGARVPRSRPRHGRAGPARLTPVRSASLGRFPHLASRCLTSNTCSSSVASTAQSGRREPQGCPPHPSPSRVASTTSAPRCSTSSSSCSTWRPPAVARERPDHRGRRRQDPRRRGPRHLPHPGQPRGVDPALISALTGITDGMVADAEPIEVVLPCLLEFLGGAVLVAHNASFDRRFVQANLERHGYQRLANRVVCTARLARKLLPATRCPTSGWPPWPPTWGRRSPPATGP